MMYALMKLDAYTVKPLWKLAVSFLLVPIILGLIVNSYVSMMVTMTFVAFLLNLVFSIGEQSGFERLYGSLPVNQKTIVMGRYLFSSLVLICFALCSYVIYLLISLTQGSVDLMNGLAFLGVSMFIACFFLSIQFPIYFCVEFSKASFMSIIPYIICFAIGSPLISQLMKQPEFYQRVMDILQYFQQNSIVEIGLSLLSCVLILGVSCMVATRLVEKKGNTIGG